MPEESYGFAKARVRLEEIVTQVRKKDTSLEKSLDLLEEGVRLANQCTELIDHADWEAGDLTVPSDGNSERTVDSDADVAASESADPVEAEAAPSEQSASAS